MESHVLIKIAEVGELKFRSAGDNPGSDGIDHPFFTGCANREIVSEKAVVVPAPPDVTANCAGSIVQICLRQSTVDERAVGREGRDNQYQPEGKQKNTV